MHVPRRLLAYLVLLASLVSSALSQGIAPVITVEHGPNAAAQQAKPYVILISLDGFRYDYARRYKATNLLALAARGASAPDGMIPSYPTWTYPNHYSIITGLYPEHHGIVANRFYDPARKQVYDYHDSKTTSDGTWYGGTPMWAVAEEQGMRAASFYWVASDAEIQGTRPSRYVHFVDNFPNDKRVDQVLQWLRLPAEQRPHFITLYFSDVDHAGHDHGPDSPQVAAAVSALDAEIGRLLAGLRHLSLRVDVIVVADHGMASIKGVPVLLNQLGLHDSLLEKNVDYLLYPKSEADAQRAYEELRGKSDKFVVYRRADMPPRLHCDANARLGDPVVVATGSYPIRYAPDPNGKPPLPGNHGFDPVRVPEMKAFFAAAGPDIEPGSVLRPFPNIDLYPFIAHILSLDIGHLKTGPIDGKLDPLKPALRLSGRSR